MEPITNLLALRLLRLDDVWGAVVETAILIAGGPLARLLKGSAQ